MSEAAAFQEPEEHTEVTKARHSRTNKVLATLLGLFGVIGPVVAAFISYKQAKVEAGAEIDKAHKESEAGYKAVSSPLNTMLPIVVQLAGDVAQLKAEVQVLRSQTSSAVPAPSPPMSVSPEAPPAAASPPPSLRPLLRPLPKSLHDAAEQLQ